MKDKRVEASLTRSESSQREENRILVTCLMGKILGFPISNDYLEEGSLYKKTEYYKKRRSLVDRGLIRISEDYVEITDEGVRLVSQILTGKTNEDLKWQDIYDAMKKHLSILWSPIFGMKEYMREHLLKMLLIAYPDSLGRNPREYYLDLIRRFSQHLIYEEYSNEYYMRFHHRVNALIQQLFMKRVECNDQEIVMRAREFSQRSNEIHKLQDKLTILMSTFYPIDFKKPLFYIIAPVAITTLKIKSISLMGLGFILFLLLSLIFAIIITRFPELLLLELASIKFFCIFLMILVICAVALSLFTRLKLLRRRPEIKIRKRVSVSPTDSKI